MATLENDQSLETIFSGTGSHWRSLLNALDRWGTLVKLFASNWVGALLLAASAEAMLF